MMKEDSVFEGDRVCYGCEERSKGGQCRLATGCRKCMSCICCDDVISDSPPLKTASTASLDGE